jgi:tetratricopeptide (TPR) repeat protein
LLRKEMDLSERDISWVSFSNGFDCIGGVLDREIERSPNSWEAWSAKADLLYQQRHLAEALKACDISLELNQEDALTWKTRGDILAELRRVDEAAYCFNRAVEIEPLFLKAWCAGLRSRTDRTEPSHA